jgi:hypothetical protein
VEPGLNGGDLPAPIPWLGSAGKVAPLDAADIARKAAARPAAPQLIQIRKTPKRATNPTTSLAATSASAPAVNSGGPSAPIKPKTAKKKLPGSGIPARKVIRVLVWVRRVSQIGFVTLFLYFLAHTAFRGTFAATSSEPVRLPLPVEGFLLADPFVGAMTLLSTHSLYRGLAWSLSVFALTLVFGRVFCGWICPFGTLHHFFGWIFPSRYLRGNKRVETNKTHWWQAGKYYIMWGFLGAAAVGSSIGGLLDPICVAVRTIGLGVIPALQYFGVRSATVIASSNVRVLQSATDGAQDVLARTVWTANQSYFHQTWLIVFFLIGILFMNRFIPRFWCRALCPLVPFSAFSRAFRCLAWRKTTPNAPTATCAWSIARAPTARKAA